MILYSIMVFGISALIGVFGILIYRGNTKLIHEYHMTNVKDSQILQYAKAFGKCLLFLALIWAVSGVTAFWGDDLIFVIISVAIGFLGLIAFLIAISIVQEKYNNSIW